MNASQMAPIQTSSQNSKRHHSQQSLNHLLNFTLPPRVQHAPPLPRRTKRPIKSQAWNKEKFINAQYRFVMRPTGDYTVHFADPDIYFHWQDILQVIMTRSPIDDSGSDHEGAANCPICLSPSTAPRITKCGHVFCYPCILHYLEMGENPKWSRCPICFEAITSSQLKAVQWSNAACSPPVPQSQLSLRLMQRPHITTLALPRSDTWPPTTSSPSMDVLPLHEAPFHFLPDVQQFARFMLATPEQLILDISRDINDLNLEARLLSSDNDAIGLAFVQRAREKCVAMLHDARDMEMNLSVKEEIEKKERALRDARRAIEDQARREAAASRVAAERHASDANPDRISAIVLSAESASIQPLAAQSRVPRPKRNVNPPPHSISSYLFYQAATGANIFLHPLDIRILLSHFGSYTAFPNEVTVGVVSSSESTVDEDLRKRCKYLAHLAEGADVVFIEADLEPVVGPEALKPFENLLKTRLSRRRDRAKREEKARIKAEEKERAKLMDILSASQSQMLLYDRKDEDLMVNVGDNDDRNAEAGREGSNPDNSAHVTSRAASTPTGAWGSRSFASAAHSGVVSTGQTINPSTRARLTEREPLIDWDHEQAWHELEEAQLNRGSGHKRGRNKIVILGGGGGRRLG